VRGAAKAQAALNDARRWLLQPGSGAYGRARWHALRDAADNLADLPYKGAPVPHQPGLRQLVVSGYRLLYRVEPDTGDSETGDSETAGDIAVLALFGPGQQ